jgi:DNA gyrase subunit A
MEESKLGAEHAELTAQIGVLGAVMADDAAVFALMKQETAALRATHAVPRRSQIVDAAAELSDTDLLANDK